MRILLILLLTFSFRSMAQGNYEIYPIKDLFKMMGDSRKKPLFQDKKTLALVFEYGSKYILLPNGNPVSKGLLINDKESLDSIINAGVIPIEDDNPDMWQIHQQEILEIDRHIPQILGKLSEYLGVEINPFDTSSAYFNKITQAVNKSIAKNGKDKTYDNLIFPMGIFAIAIIKNHDESCRWQYQTVYKYNPYKIVYLKSDGRKDLNGIPYDYNVWGYLGKAFWKMKKFDFGDYMFWASGQIVGEPNDDVIPDEYR